MQRSACVDLGDSFKTHIYLQNLASIQPRTSPPKFGRSPCTDPPGSVCTRILDGSCRATPGPRWWASRGDDPTYRYRYPTLALRKRTNACNFAHLHISNLHICIRFTDAHFLHIYSSQICFTSIFDTLQRHGVKTYLVAYGEYAVNLTGFLDLR